MKWEYKIINREINDWRVSQSLAETETEINKLGRLGWHVVNTYQDRGSICFVLERGKETT